MRPTMTARMPAGRGVRCAVPWAMART